ncbi:MAG: hypothetical protein JO153_08065 [Solirubrobacterales bacterium]|nr:hypothetical protein [Solirubrobacterales bacterium]MBV9916444.1 hypothetical protein [Solirubrobacterales bacterium]
MSSGRDMNGASAAVRINLRPLGNPLPLGLYSFGVGMLLLAAQSAGWVPPKETSQVGLVLATFVFPLEGVAAITAFWARDTLAGTVLGLFTTSWLALGLLFITAQPGATSVTLAFYLLGFAAVVSSLAVIALAGKPLIALVLTLSATRALLAGIYEASSATALDRAAGYVAAAIAVVAWYAGTAFLLEDVRQEPLLPVLRRGAAKSAVAGELSDQLHRADGEAGVRQQL